MEGSPFAWPRFSVPSVSFAMFVACSLHFENELVARFPVSNCFFVYGHKVLSGTFICGPIVYSILYHRKGVLIYLVKVNTVTLNAE